MKMNHVVAPKNRSDGRQNRIDKGVQGCASEGGNPYKPDAFVFPGHFISTSSVPAVITVYLVPHGSQAHGQFLHHNLDSAFPGWHAFMSNHSNFHAVPALLFCISHIRINPWCRFCLLHPPAPRHTG